MTLPLSYQTKLDAIDRDIRSAEKSYRSNPDIVALGSDFTDILVRLCLLLDRVMNEVWTAFNDQDPTKKKANVYFPSRRSLVDFDSFLAKSQLGKLASRSPETYNILLSLQPFSPDAPAWLSSMLQIASDRHTRDAGIREDEIVHGVVLGINQSVHVKRLELKNGRLTIDGATATNMTTGAIEPLAVAKNSTTVAIATDLNSEALPLMKKCHYQTGQAIWKIRSAISGN